MSDVKNDPKKNNSQKRKKILKLVSVGVLFVAVLVVFSIAWFTFSRQSDATGLNLEAVGRDSIEGTIDAFYSADGSGGDWDELTDDGISLYPNQSIVLKLVVANSSDTGANYKLKFSSLKVKYYEIQPFVQSDWQEINGYWQNGETEFGYDQSYVWAGDYTCGDEIIDYHTITTAQYMEFLKPATNAMRYNICGFETVSGETTQEKFEQAKQKTLSISKYNEAMENIKTAPIICETDKQDLSVLNTAEPCEVVPKDQNYDYFITNVIDGSQTADSYVSEDGTIHLEPFTTGVLYMTVFFDPQIYSQASLTIDGIQKEVTLENSNPFMFQNVYLEGIKLEIVK